jgi:hypothetical protein
MTAINTTSATASIAILKTSQRGALLITDGSRVAWVMGRTQRADGSFTPSALTALATGKTVEEWRAEDEAWRAAREQERADRERAFQEGKELTSVSLPALSVREGSEKSWKVRTNRTQWLYGKYVAVWEYLPKSVVKVSVDNGVATLTMPKWFLAKNQWLTNLAQ